MSKIEWNPRKKAHIDFLHVLITELHNEIFQESFEIIQSPGEEEKTGCRAMPPRRQTGTVKEFLVTSYLILTANRENRMKRRFRPFLTILTKFFRTSFDLTDYSLRI